MRDRGRAEASRAANDVLFKGWSNIRKAGRKKQEYILVSLVTVKSHIPGIKRKFQYRIEEQISKRCEEVERSLGGGGAGAVIVKSRCRD